MDLMMLSLQFLEHILWCDLQEYRVYKPQFLKSQNRLDEHELQSTKAPFSSLTATMEMNFWRRDQQQLLSLLV